MLDNNLSNIYIYIIYIRYITLYNGTGYATDVFSPPTVCKVPCDVIKNNKQAQNFLVSAHFSTSCTQNAMSAAFISQVLPSIYTGQPRTTSMVYAVWRSTGAFMIISSYGVITCMALRFLFHSNLSKTCRNNGPKWQGTE